MKIIDYIKKLDFFDKYDSNLEIREKTEDIFIVYAGDDKEKYSIRFFPVNTFKSIEDKKEKIDKLIEQGRKLYPILKVGLLEELELCYRITDYINGKKRYDNEIENYELGYYIGDTIKSYHNLSKTIKNDNWVKNYNHKINNLFHEYYLCEYIGGKDYILLDYVEQYKNLIDDRETIEIFSFSDIRDIPVDDNGRIYLFGIQGIVEADPYFEFKDININYYKDEAYSAGIIDGYFGGKPSKLFFKTIALYTIVEALSKEFTHFSVVKCEVVKLKILELLGYYNDFDSIYPNWYMEIKNKLSR